MQDFFYPVASLAGQNSENRLLVWQYFKDNFDKIFKLVETGSPFLFSAIISASASGFTTKEKANEIESFFQEHPVERSTRKINQIIEKTNNDANFAEWLKN